MRASVRACVRACASGCMCVFCVHVCFVYMCVYLRSGVWLCAVVRACVAICVVVLLPGIWFQIANALPDVLSYQKHCDEAQGALMIFTEEKAASEKYENMFSLPIAIGILSLFPVNTHPSIHRVPDQQ